MLFQGFVHKRAKLLVVMILVFFKEHLALIIGARFLFFHLNMFHDCLGVISQAPRARESVC